MLRSAGYDIVAHPEAEVFICRHAPVPDREPRAVYPIAAADERPSDAPAHAAAGDRR
jgi:tRNA (mo5U34)-methyltransferase